MIFGYFENKLSKQNNALVSINCPSATGDIKFSAFASIRQTVNLRTQAPEAVLEDGSIATDHLINDAAMITIELNVGDVFIQQSAVNDLISKPNQTLGNISALFNNNITTAAQQRLNRVVLQGRDALLLADDSINRAGIIGNAFIGVDFKSQQEKFVDFINGIREAKALVNIEVPYRKFENMAITAYSESTDSETKSISVVIDFKELIFAKTAYTDITKLVRSPVAGAKSATEAVSEKGAQVGKAADEAVLREWLREQLGVTLFQ